MILILCRALWGFWAQSLSVFPISLIIGNSLHSASMTFVLCLVSQSHPTLCDPMDCSHQAPLSMGFLRQEYWSGLPWPPPGDLPNPGIKPRSPALQAGDSLPFEPPGKPSMTFAASQWADPSSC